MRVRRLLDTVVCSRRRRGVTDGAGARPNGEPAPGRLRNCGGRPAPVIGQPRTMRSRPARRPLRREPAPSTTATTAWRRVDVLGRRSHARMAHPRRRPRVAAGAHQRGGESCGCCRRRLVVWLLWGVTRHRHPSTRSRPARRESATAPTASATAPAAVGWAAGGGGAGELVFAAVGSAAAGAAAAAAAAGGRCAACARRNTAPAPAGSRGVLRRRAFCRLTDIIYYTMPKTRWGCGAWAAGGRVGVKVER